MFKIFPNCCLLLSNFILLWIEHIFCIMSVLLNLLWLSYGLAYGYHGKYSMCTWEEYVFCVLLDGVLFRNLLNLFQAMLITTWSCQTLEILPVWWCEVTSQWCFKYLILLWLMVRLNISLLILLLVPQDSSHGTHAYPLPFFSIFLFVTCTNSIKFKQYPTSVQFSSVVGLLP